MSLAIRESSSIPGSRPVAHAVRLSFLVMAACALMASRPGAADPVPAPQPATHPGPAAFLPDWAQVPLPDGLEPRRVIDDGRIEGHAVGVRSLIASQPCDAVLERVQVLWRSRLGVPVLGERGGRWQIASAAFADGFLTLQLGATPGGGCEGFLSRWPRPRQDVHQAMARARALLPGWPAEVTVLRQTDEQGSAGVASTISAQSTLPVPLLLERFRARLAADGFRVQRVLRSPLATPQVQSVLVAGRRDAQVTVFLNANGEFTDVAVIHERRSP